MERQIQKRCAESESNDRNTFRAPGVFREICEKWKRDELKTVKCLDKLTLQNKQYQRQLENLGKEKLLYFDLV